VKLIYSGICEKTHISDHLISLIANIEILLIRIHFQLKTPYEKLFDITTN